MAYIVTPEVRATLRKARIGDLPENPIAAAVYVRANGQLYSRINEKYHCAAKIENESLLGDGIAEEIDHDEIVEVLSTKE